MKRVCILTGEKPYKCDAHFAHISHISNLQSHVHRKVYVCLFLKYVIIAIQSYYNVIQDVLVLVEMYSYSALSNILVLSFEQYTPTQPSPMYLYFTHENVLGPRSASYPPRVDKAVTR